MAARVGGVIVVLAVLAVAACGGDDGGGLPDAFAGGDVIDAASSGNGSLSATVDGTPGVFEENFTTNYQTAGNRLFISPVFDHHRRVRQRRRDHQRHVHRRLRKRRRRDDQHHQRRVQRDPRRRVAAGATAWR